VFGTYENTCQFVKKFLETGTKQFIGNNITFEFNEIRIFKQKLY